MRLKVFYKMIFSYKSEYPLFWASSKENLSLKKLYLRLFEWLKYENALCEDECALIKVWIIKDSRTAQNFTLNKRSTILIQKLIIQKFIKSKVT